MKRRRASVVFVTGTGTGVGKTVLTALLLAHLRRLGRDALALKPFCSGGRADAEILWRLEKDRLSLEDVNPFYFDKPVAPLAAAPPESLPSLREAVAHARKWAGRCETLLIEGSGGLLVPLGPKYTVGDMILALRCPVMIVAANQLGVINHTLLTLKWLQNKGLNKNVVALMETGRPDASSGTNRAILEGMTGPAPVISVPFMSRNPLDASKLKNNVIFLQKTLARMLDHAIVSPLPRKGGLKG